MALFVEVSRVVHASRTRTYGLFSDAGSWSFWMPACFRPLLVPARPLAVGDHLLVGLRIGRFTVLPARLHVTQVLAGARIEWRAGVRGALRASHAYDFEERGGATLVRSREIWTGVLTWSRRAERRLRRHAEVIARAQLDALAGALEEPRADARGHEPS